MKRRAPYPPAEKGRLVAEVRLLANELRRPVSSKDLTARWRKFPEKRPVLLQYVSQVLLKAARPCPDVCGLVYRVGAIGSAVYYAPDASPDWAGLLERHRISLRAKAVCKLGIVDHARYLLSTEHETEARHGLAGFVAEWAQVLGSRILQHGRDRDELAVQVGEASRLSDADFIPVNPSDLIDRSMAREVLLTMATADLGSEHGRCVNFNRPLAWLRWPQSGHHIRPERLVYRRLQLRLWGQWKWPAPTDDPVTAKARLTVSFAV